MLEDLRRENMSFPSCPIVTSHDGDVAASVQEALVLAAESKQSGKPQVVVVCGSFFIMREARAQLGVDQPLDVLEQGQTLNENSLVSAALTLLCSAVRTFPCSCALLRELTSPAPVRRPWAP